MNDDNSFLDKEMWKLMNRLIKIFLCCMMILALAIPACAAGTDEYYLEELGMSVSVPSDFDVFTREAGDDDSNIDKYGIEKNELADLMKDTNIYLCAWGTNINKEMFISMTDSLSEDYNRLSDFTLSTIASSLDSALASAGVTVTETEIYKHGQIKFIKLYSNHVFEDLEVYSLQYGTSYDGKNITISMNSYLGQFTPELEAELQSIVDSIVFDGAPQAVTSDFTPTTAFTYTDAKSGTSFIVPANWVESEPEGDTELIDVKFLSLEESGMSMQYGVVDAWDEMTASERRGYTRADIDNSFITEDILSEAFGVAKADVKTSTYGGREYFTATASSTSHVSILTFTLDISYAIHIDNGYIHFFVFSGTKDNEFYKDFEALLDSATYIFRYDSPGIADPSTVVSVFFSLLFTITIYTAPIAVYRFAIRKSPMDAKKAKRIVIIYGICAAFTVSVFRFVLHLRGHVGAAVLLWSYVNYRILIGGEAKQNNDASGNDDSDVSPVPNPLSATDEVQDCADSATAENKPTTSFCSNCGVSQTDDGEFCSHCGAKV